jgi:DNA-binding CsgD family transcriptional regulator
MSLLMREHLATLAPTPLLSRTSPARPNPPETVETHKTTIFVVASPQLVATSVSRALRNAGWTTGDPLASPSGLADVSVGANDVIILIENASGYVSGAVTGTVVATVRRVFPTVGIVLLAANDSTTVANDNRARVLPSAANIPMLCSEVSRLSGNVAEPGPGLTSRHLEILQLIARGATTDEAGVILGIASKTVNNHLSAAYQRLGTRNLTQAVLAAARAGLIDTGAL